jgi:hypothetical protein
MIRIVDRTCVDCGGEVTLYMVPDKVWDGLGFQLQDYACLDCFARRLNPENPPTDLDQLPDEIIRQYRRFKLKAINTYDDNLRLPLDRAALGVSTPGEESVRMVTAERIGGRYLREKT